MADEVQHICKWTSSAHRLSGGSPLPLFKAMDGTVLAAKKSISCAITTTLAESVKQWESGFLRDRAYANDRPHFNYSSLSG